MNKKRISQHKRQFSHGTTAVTAGVAFLMAGVAAPSRADFTQFSPGVTQVATIAEASCLGQLDTTLTALEASAIAADGAGLIAEVVGALDPTGIAEAVAITAQVAAWTLSTAAFGLETDAEAQLPSCEQDFYGSVKVTAGGLSVTGDSIFNSNLDVSGALDVNGGATISGGATITSGAGTGNSLVVDGTSARIQSADGTDFVAVNMGSGVSMNGNDATFTLNGTSASLLNSTGRGLNVTGTQATLSGGTNSSVLTLADGDAGGTTLVVGGSTSGSATLFSATTNATTTISTVTIGTATTTNANNIVGAVNNIGTTVAGSTNTIGNVGTSVNTLTGATNTITSAAGLNQVVTNAAGAATGTTVRGTGTTDGVSLAGTSGGQTAMMTLGQDNRYFTGNPVANFFTTGGAPIRVTGVADAKYDFDAPNFRQLKSAYAGAASAAALAAVPDPIAGKKYTIGMGYGRYEGLDAAAIGFRGVVKNNFSVTAGVGFNKYTSTYSVGAGFSW